MIQYVDICNMPFRLIDNDFYFPKPISILWADGSVKVDSNTMEDVERYFSANSNLSVWLLE